MSSVSFTVAGNPIPWERVRSRAGQHFTAPRTRFHEFAIATAARKARVRRVEGAVQLTVRFFRKDAQPCDVDNLAKAVQDALNGIAYADDRQITTLLAVKAIDRENPRTEVELIDLGDLAAPKRSRRRS